MAANLAILRIFLLAVTIGASSPFNSQNELRRKEFNQEQVIQLSHHVHPKSSDPSRVIQLSWQPRALFYRGFLSEEECAYPMSWVHGKKNSSMKGNDSPMLDINGMRDDIGISMDADDETARRIGERIYAWTFLPKENSTSLSVHHFGPEASKHNSLFRYKICGASWFTIASNSYFVSLKCQSGWATTFPSIKEQDIVRLHEEQQHPQAY